MDMDRVIATGVEAHEETGSLARLMSRIDIFDRIAGAAAVGVAGAIVWMIATADPAARPARVSAGVSDSRFVSSSPEEGKKEEAAGRLMLVGKVAEAEAIAGEILEKNPASASAHRLLAEAAVYRMDAFGAVAHYRDALLLNPDYADKRSTGFIGKQIRKAAEEAVATFDTRLTENGADEEARRGLKAAHELKRLLAGSCQ